MDIYLKYCCMYGSVDPDQMPHSAASGSTLFCKSLSVPIPRVIMVLCILWVVKKQRLVQVNSEDADLTWQM